MKCETDTPGDALPREMAQCTECGTCDPAIHDAESDAGVGRVGGDHALVRVRCPNGCTWSQPEHVPVHTRCPRCFDTWNADDFVVDFLVAAVHAHEAMTAHAPSAQTPSRAPRASSN